MKVEDESIFAGYRAFLKTGSGEDLINRLKLTEAKYMMEGMKATTVEQKGLAMERMHTVYLVRTMLDDLAKPKVVSS